MIQFTVTVQSSSHSRNTKPLLMTSSEDGDELKHTGWLLTKNRSELALQFGSSKWSRPNERGMLELQNFSLKEKKEKKSCNQLERAKINRYNLKYKQESSEVLRKGIWNWRGMYLCKKKYQWSLLGLEDKWQTLVTQVMFMQCQTRPATSHLSTGSGLQPKSLLQHALPPCLGRC